MRPQYIAGVRSALKPGGTVAGVFYMNPDLDPGETGPPFGIALEELIQLWQDGGFEVQEHWVPEVAYEGREGRERFMRLKESPLPEPTIIETLQNTRRLAVTRKVARTKPVVKRSGTTGSRASVASAQAGREKVPRTPRNILAPRRGARRTSCLIRRFHRRLCSCNPPGRRTASPHPKPHPSPRATSPRASSPAPQSVPPACESAP